MDTEITQHDEIASSSIYIIGPDPEHPSGIHVACCFDDEAMVEAELARWGPGAQRLEHSHRALRKLPMPLLMGILRASGDDFPIPITQMKRDELVSRAYGRLWTAAFRTNGAIVPNPREEQKRMATTIGKGPKVREMRDARSGGSAVKKSAKKATGAAAAKGPGRPPVKDDPFAGKKFRLTDTSKNPRREGTHGFRSMEIVLAAKGHGISYEDYLAKGGRRVDLKGSLDLKQVEML